VAKHQLGRLGGEHGEFWNLQTSAEFFGGANDREDIVLCLGMTAVLLWHPESP